MRVTSIVADALGDSSYLLVSNGVAAVVDPQRDIRPYVDAAKQQNATIQYVFETHVHNDYISGGPELAALGAEIIAPAKAALAFPHRPINDGDEVQVGGVAVRAMAAPGHTYEHTAYIVLEDGQPRGAFTGGAVLMGSAGRSDLLGPDHTEELTRLQWETARRLASFLTPTSEILPTHGAGSFCSSTGSDGDRRGPLSVELSRNPLFNAPGFDPFRSQHLGDLAPIPAYYQHMGPINRNGPKIYGTPPEPPKLDLDGIDRVMKDVTLVDVRARADHVAGHIPGSVGIEQSDSFLAYVGWLLPFNSPLALVTYDGAQAGKMSVDLLRIGYEDVRGWVPFGDWTKAGRPLRTLTELSLDEAAEKVRSGEAKVLDVRFGYEQRKTPLEGSVQHSFDTLPEWAGTLGTDPLIVVCASGQRATIAASYLRSRGIDLPAVIEGGVEDVARKLERARA
jgi:hydroxyacylglutathione hydrolase